MRLFRLASCLLAWLSIQAWTPIPAWAEQVSTMRQSPWQLCRLAIGVAERGGAMPPHLMAAIGQVESGRRDPVSGTMQPWPWAVNAEGQAFFFDSKGEAVVAVRAMQTRGVHSIDVGCMQVNLMHHPNAFPTLEAAFEPQANASYAARFLRELYARSNDWSKATGMYHSATAVLAAGYRRRVAAALPGETRPAPAIGLSKLAQAWGATLTTGPRGVPPAGRGPDTHRGSSIVLAYRPPPPRG